MDIPSVSFREALKVWIRVALLSFGGPAGQISVMHKIIIEEKKWITEERFLHALNYCMLLPGPEAQQLAVYIGWLLHKYKGGITAGILFVLPGFISILILSIIYSLYKNTGIVNSLFFGLKAAVLAIVVQAVINIGRKALKNNFMYAIAGGAFIAIFFFDIPFPFIIIAAALAGISSGKLRSDNKNNHTMVSGRDIKSAVRPALIYLLKTVVIFGGLWVLPTLILLLFAGPQNVFTQQAVFFSQAAVVTFGGAYAVLAYISQEAVFTYGWLKPGEMLDGLGMAETTPGPLIQVVQFVGYMGAFRIAEEFNPLTAGILASILVTWVTFMPSFLWIFMGAPYIEKLRGNKYLNSALTGITAAVVGVILNLAVWFFLNTVFGNVEINWYGPLRIFTPILNSADWRAIILTALAFVGLFRFKLNIITLIFLSAAAGLIIILL